MAIIRQNPPTDSFVKSTRGWLRDPKLSGKAKGYLSYIASHAEDYDLTVEQMVAEMSEGPAAVRAGLVELEKRGYLNRPRRRNPDGTLGGYDWEIIDFPGGASKKQPGSKIESGSELGKRGGSAGHNQSRKPQPGSDLQEQGASAGRNQSRFSNPKKNNEEDNKKTMKGSGVKCGPSGRSAPSGTDGKNDHPALILVQPKRKRVGFEDWRQADYDLLVEVVGSNHIISDGSASTAGTFPVQVLYDALLKYPNDPKEWPGLFLDGIRTNDPRGSVDTWLARFGLKAA